MKLKSLSLKNFCGVKALDAELPQIIALCGKNGMGKTTILNAIRYALTGKEPEGDIIRYGSQSTEVTVVVDDGKSGVAYTRIKDREKPSAFKIDGKKTTLKALNENISEVIGIPLDKVEILSSADIVSAMKPQEFASLILGYIPEKLTLEKVMTFVPATTPGMIDIIDANLPVEGIDLDVLDSFDETARAVRKELKSELQAKKLMYDKHGKEKPELNREEIEEKLKQINNLDNEYKLYLEKLKAYESALNSRNQLLETLKRLKSEAETITVGRPDPALKDSLSNKKSESENRIVKQKTAINGVQSALASLKGTLESLDKSVCPISPLITCTQDKSVAKAEIEETIKATEESLAIMEENIKAAEEELAKANAELVKFGENEALYNKKIMLNKQIKEIEDALPAEPVKPDEVEKKDVETEKYQLNKQLEALNDYEEGEKLLGQITKLEVEVDDYEKIVKMLAEKGPVRNGVVQSYLGVFEKLCNERSVKIRPEYTFRFASENGVVVYMKNNDTGVELTLNELSGGERAYMLFILIDMLNELVGSRILMLDELSVMDAETFNVLLDLILNHKTDYDHIILSTVDHEELRSALVSHEIKVIETLSDL